MGAPGSSHSEVTQDDAHWRTAGDRIQTLLDASSAAGPVARERAELLVGEVTDLYGAALQRIMRRLAGSPELVEQFSADDLIASLLLVHGLHPHDARRRIEDALDKVRPYLGSHGGDVAVLSVTEGPDGAVVRLQFSGSCKSCPSSAVTLELTVEDAIRTAAPEVSNIEVVAAEPKTGVIPADSLLSRIHRGGHTAWHPVPELTGLKHAEVGGFRVAGTTVLVCRLGDNWFVYRDRCGHCGDSLAGAALHRRIGSADPVLRCPRCHAHFDVVHAGSCVDENSSAAEHLEPLPVLIRDGVLSIAMEAEPTAAGVP
ncbi:Rieske 2Fe-2S domain-containing protein [Mycobacterium sp. CBMA293]|uniref:NifU family protein n=1 Tax=unclassified Mycolicibacterium TaxID=2636767 RepID=UPI0013273925|nr:MULTISPECIES: NifU family protein [unclassified Mycolicibacterium]MUL48169.1 Rieske 2Fe-2S domain-containing protein [Mycolicibacterium sp. CBMA 360]MUL92750.1 Rieske 2Fe-2S domain-containing protein [Mycolicibacterium sp. CBMA 230]MUM31594.1 Rieske 2Fe-2S domain-containing protein [Mycolicibacterium sp. CBMA 361]MUL57662.1 Rieske 2Fe-2S domain-containing protein [Mycolicibacterium sp. CBMA 335]MUL70702.1 Rieske 2Fe-2S domain-containing protein [Mycolicibacterium sp. CBMA 311]